MFSFQGCVVEFGSHQELLENSNGHYFKLWNAAASWGLEEQQ